MKNCKGRFAKINNKLLIALICIFIATMLSFGGVFAKYYYDYEKRVNVQSLEFYFSSDLLTDNGNVYTLNPGTTEIEFTIKNYEDNLRFSQSEVSYTITSNGGMLSLQNGTLSGPVGYDTIKLTGLTDGGSYTVTCVGTMGKNGAQGFRQVLSATFMVKLGKSAVYMYITSDDYVVNLTVFTEDLSGDVVVDIPLGLIPDNTCPYLEDLKATDNSFIVNNFEKYSSKKFTFFKTASYIDDDFIVELEDDLGQIFSAELKAPA